MMNEYSEAQTKVPAVRIEIAQAVLKSKVYESLGGIRAFNWCARVAWLASTNGGEATGENWHARTQHDGSIHVVVSGGKSELARLVGRTSEEDSDVPFDALMEMSRIHLAVEDEDEYVEGPLIASCYWSAAPDEDAVVSFTLSSVWNNRLEA